MRHHRTSFVLGLLALVLGACGSGIGPTRFTNPDFDFQYLERVAVIPLENLTGDRQAGSRATRLLITELLASGAVDVVEPGEVDAAMLKLPGVRGLLSTDQVVALGEALGVQGVLQGTVTDSELSRSGPLAIPVVTLDLHLLETETGAAVWATTHTEQGGSVGAKLLGTGSEPIAATTRRCVRRSLASLLD